MADGNPDEITLIVLVKSYTNKTSDELNSSKRHNKSNAVSQTLTELIHQKFGGNTMNIVIGRVSRYCSGPPWKHSSSGERDMVRYYSETRRHHSQYKILVNSRIPGWFL